MRILMINSFFSVGGPPRIVKGLYDVLTEDGNECLLAATREKPLENMEVFQLGSKYSANWNALKARIFDNEGFSAKKATQNLVRKIVEYNPDVIHLHNLHGYYINIRILFKFLEKANIPVVWTLHDCWAFTGHCSHFDFIGCEKWKTGCHHCPQKKMYPKSMVLDKSKRNWEEKKLLFSSPSNMTIVTPSNWLAELVKNSFLNKYPVEVIHNGIDLEVFKPTPSTWKEDHGITRPVILACAAVWGQRKGYDDVLKLAESLPKYQIVIVGISKKQKMKLPSSIIGIQRTDSVRELVKLYSAADVFINPTYEDNFPTVNLEALACGTPVITYDTGGSPECIDQSCGVVVEKGNMQEMVEKIPSAMKLKRDECIAFSQRFSKHIKYSEYYKYFTEFIIGNK